MTQPAAEVGTNPSPGCSISTLAYTNQEKARESVQEDADWKDVADQTQLARAYSRFVASMKATRPDVVRGIRFYQVFRQAARHWMRGDLAALYAFSEAADQLDEFWSHSWRASLWLKLVNIVFLKHSMAAFVVGTCCACLGGILFVTGVLPAMAANTLTQCQWCTLLGTVGWYLTLIFGRRGTLAFLDVACINQQDAQMKAEALLSIGAILKNSKSLLVLWDPTYVRRLWCIFELSAFLHTHQDDKLKSMVICPPLLGPLLLGFHFCLTAMAIIYLYVPASGMGGGLLVMVALFFPCFPWVVFVLRRYWRDVDATEQQIRQFSVDDCLSSC